MRYFCENFFSRMRRSPAILFHQVLFFCGTGNHYVLLIISLGVGNLKKRTEGALVESLILLCEQTSRPPFWAVKVATLFVFKIIFIMWSIFKVIICYNIASVLCFGFLALRHMRSLTRDQTPCSGRQSLNHWTARKVPRGLLLKDTLNFTPPPWLFEFFIKVSGFCCHRCHCHSLKIPGAMTSLVHYQN